MLSLLLVSLAAGVCYGQSEQGKFSDCAMLQSIGSECAMSHLDYLKDHNEYQGLQTLAHITEPGLLLNVMDVICSDTMSLKAYYQCAFKNLTTCLKMENSTQVMGAPDADRIAGGIVELCNDRADMNKSCITDEVNKVTECFTKFMQDNVQGKQCELFDGLVGCVEEFSTCKGIDAVKNFIISARPAPCPYTSSAQSFLPCLLLLLGTLLAHFFRVQ